MEEYPGLFTWALCNLTVQNQRCDNRADSDVEDTMCLAWKIEAGSQSGNAASF
jgi:hypothetical protein